jgi:hypothetical protein
MSIKTRYLKQAEDPRAESDLEDNRAEWECPAFRRLVTKYAEDEGDFQSEGNFKTGGQPTHSAKNA